MTRANSKPTTPIDQVVGCHHNNLRLLPALPPYRKVEALAIKVELVCYRILRTLKVASSRSFSKSSSMTLGGVVMLPRVQADARKEKDSPAFTIQTSSRHDLMISRASRVSLMAQIWSKEWISKACKTWPILTGPATSIRCQRPVTMDLTLEPNLQLWYHLKPTRTKKRRTRSRVLPTCSSANDLSF